MARATKTKTADKEFIRSVKGFNHELQCRGFQFEVGKTYKVEGKIEACENGFHACENPFDIWSYYPVVDDLGRLSRYADVEQSGDISRHDGDNKIASAEITIKAEIALPEFVRRAVDAVVKLTKGKGDDPSGDSAKIGSSGDSAKIGSSGDSAKIGSSGDYAKIGSSGDYAQIGSSGYSAQIGSSGYSAKIGSSGDYAQIGSSGYSAKIGSSGYSAKIGSSGYSAQIGSSGYSAQIGSSGDSAKIGSSGDYAQIVAEGKDAVIASAGRNTTATGVTGTWISLAEFDSNGKCVGFATGCIGQNGLEPNVAYVARGGKLVAA